MLLLPPPLPSPPPNSHTSVPYKFPKMGCNSRDTKSLRSNRKPRRHHHSAAAAAATATASVAHDQPPPDPPTAFPGGGGGYCTEDQLEDLLLKNLDFVYSEALSKLVALGYPDDVALHAILCSGHCYGSMDVLSNILHNAVSYINSSAPNSDAESEEEGNGFGPGGQPFSDIRHLVEYTLAGMVCLLQEMRPHLTRGDAMWCLLMSDLHMVRASAMEIPPLPPAAEAETDGGCSMPFNVVCRFQGGEKGNLSSSVVDESSKQFKFPPSMKSFLKRNSTNSAAGSRRNSKLSLPPPNAKLDTPGLNSLESDTVLSVLKSLESMSLGEGEEKGQDGVEDPRKEMIMSLVEQIRELEEQVKERKEWAQQKAIQAAQKLSSDLTELKILRMEREENQMVKKGKQALEDTTMKRLSEMENALRKASGQVDRANAAVRELEAENAEIRAEMEASKLNAAESVSKCLEVAKREKKCLKRMLAWEKQKEKLQDELAAERKKIVQVQRLINQCKGESEEAELKWKHGVKAKEQALANVEEERRAKEAADSNAKRKLEVLRQKIEIDFQRYKDDIQRLEEDLSRLRSSSESTHSNHLSSDILVSGDRNGKTPKEADGKASVGMQKLQKALTNQASHGWTCLMCKKDEVSVVFLPCAHQVLCASCGRDHEKKSKACPCCGFRVEERIRVYGPSS